MIENNNNMVLQNGYEINKLGNKILLINEVKGFMFVKLMFINEVKFQQNNGNFNLSVIGSYIVYSGNFMNMYNLV